MRRFPFALLAILLLPTALTAQHRFSAALAISDPRGEFDANTDTGFGFVAGYRYGFGTGGVLALGANGSFNNYGSSRRTAPLSTTIPEIRVDVETTNNIAYVEGALELQAPSGRLRPYAVLTGGAGFFYTTSSLEDPETHETILSDTNQSDWTWVWSAGGGLRATIREIPRETGEPSRLYIDVGARRLQGGDVEYLREGSLVTPGGEVIIDERLTHSEIELIIFHVGVTYEF